MRRRVGASVVVWGLLLAACATAAVPRPRFHEPPRPRRPAPPRRWYPDHRFRGRGCWAGRRDGVQRRRPNRYRPARPWGTGSGCGVHPGPGVRDGGHGRWSAPAGRCPGDSRPAGGDPITFSAAPGTTWLLAPAGDGPNPASLTFDGSTVASIDEAGPSVQPGSWAPAPHHRPGMPSGWRCLGLTLQSGDRAVVATLETPDGAVTGTASGGSVWYLPPGAVRLVVGGEVARRAGGLPRSRRRPDVLESACATVDGATERWWRLPMTPQSGCRSR